MPRPELNENISLDDFREYYWLKEELAAFCRKKGIVCSGGKLDITDRIESYLKTGGVTGPEKHGKKYGSRFDWANRPPSPETMITDSYKNTENVRAFMKRQIGPHFRFNVIFCRWMKQNAGKTMAEAVKQWQIIHSGLKDGSIKTDIAPQFQYNTYIRDFLADNPGLKMTDAVRFWNLNKITKGSKKYCREDLLLIQNYK